MAKYEIEYTVERWYRITVEAESEEKALELFHDNEVDWSTAEEYGSELQDTILVSELEEAKV
jgi:hypothetical protein